jgi:hypothetical protein
MLDGATYTGDMRSVFLATGLFSWGYDHGAKRGDVYLAESKHTAMCQDGGSDGVLGYDALSEFNRSEDPNNRYTGKVGDQDGYESVIRDYYDDGWNGILYYNGKGDFLVDEDGEDVDMEVSDHMAILYDGSDGKVYYWTGDPESVPYHVSGDEKTALEKVYGLKLKKLDKPTADAIMGMCKARKAWREQGIAAAVKGVS